MNTIFKVTEFVKDPVQFVNGETTADEMFKYEDDAYEYAEELIELAEKKYGVVFTDDDSLYAFDYFNEAKKLRYELTISEVEIN